MGSEVEGYLYKYKRIIDWVTQEFPTAKVKGACFDLGNAFAISIELQYGFPKRHAVRIEWEGKNGERKSLPIAELEGFLDSVQEAQSQEK